MDHLRDFPTMFRQMAARIFQMENAFKLRAFFMILGLVLYVLSPLDIIPEAVFGVIGLIDDILLVGIVLMVLTSAFYTAYSNNFRREQGDIQEDIRANENRQ